MRVGLKLVVDRPSGQPTVMFRLSYYLLVALACGLLTGILYLETLLD